VHVSLSRDLELEWDADIPNVAFPRTAALTWPQASVQFIERTLVHAAITSNRKRIRRYFVGNSGVI